MEDILNVRKQLFSSLDAATSAMDFANFQRQLLTAIIQAEELKANAKDPVSRSNFGLHNRQCRSYGDAMAWSLLHRHTIRQLGGDPIHPPNLTGMPDVVARYLEIVDDFAKHGLFSIIADLTNIIRVGDIILVEDPESPTLIEVKGKKLHVVSTSKQPGKDAIPNLVKSHRSSRLHRQVVRMLNIAEYLSTGFLEADELEESKVAVELDVPTEHYWEEVDTAVKGALVRGECVVTVQDNHWIWATASDEPSGIPTEIIQNWTQVGTMRIGCHLIPLEEMSNKIMPPFNWDISQQCRFELMEGGIMVLHIVDLKKILGLSKSNASISRVGVDDPEVGPDTTFIDVSGETTRHSGLNINRVIFEFQRLESVANFMLESSLSVTELADDESFPPGNA